MGNSPSLPKHPRKRSLRSPFPKRTPSQKGPISHTFTILDDDQRLDQLNVNLATEEELMTLPGIGREVARNVVEHRRAIGRFRKVEDLALVRGVGAERFEAIKSEVCVKSNSCSSSRAQSYDSLSAETRLTPRGPNRKIVDVNSAGVFELQCVPGMSQEMAANIVHYRCKKGPFKKIDDLLKVKSVDLLRLSNMRHFLTVEGVSRSTSEILTNGTNTVTVNGTIPNGINGTVARHRKSSSAPIKFNVSNGLLSSSMNDIFELLSAYSPRPTVLDEFRHSRTGRDAFRIATWNLHEFSMDKAQNLGVKEVVCRTILENGWSIVCFQEVEDVEALQLVCNELNNPKLRRVAEFKQNSREWNVCMQRHQTAILYDIHSGGIGVSIETFKEAKLEDYKGTLVQFTVGGTVDFTVLNVQLPEEFPVDRIGPKIEEVIPSKDNFLLLGDFSKLRLGTNGATHIDRLEPVLPLHTSTTYTNFQKFRCSDNAFVNGGSKALLTGSWGVVRQGLTHLAVPNGWSWGGPVSPHCPLWVEFYVRAPPDDEKL